MDWEEFSRNFNANFSEDFRRTFEPRSFEERFVRQNLAAEAQNVYSYFEISLNGENYVSFNFERGRDFRNTFVDVCENMLSFVNIDLSGDLQAQVQLERIIKPYKLMKINGRNYLFLKIPMIQREEPRRINNHRI